MSLPDDAPSGPETSRVLPNEARPSSPSASSTQPSRERDEFPDASSTGVDSEASLTPYSVSLTISEAGTVIEGRRVTGTLVVAAPDVVISKSEVIGNILVTETGSLDISDSTVDGGAYDGSALGDHDLTMRRVEVVGARQSVSCSARCDIQDSWLHDQYILPGSDWHGDGFISNGGDDMLLRHNTLACDSRPTGVGGACSAALAAYGDFAPITDLTVDNNLFLASPAGYCAYAGYDPQKPFGAMARGVVFTDNVFERGRTRSCAAFGAVTAVGPPGAGNVFRGNVWDDGTALRAP